MPHTPPTRPWQYVASDMFEINGKQYLLTVDRYTKYPLIDYMPNPVSSHAVTEKTKTYCAMFGRPDEITTDGDPQYSGNRKTIQRIHEELGHLSHNELTSLPEEQRIYRKTRTTRLADNTEDNQKR